MVKSGKRTRDKSNRYDSDDGFIEKDETISKKRKSEKESNKSWELSSGKQPRRIEISEFKGTTLINIREFYQKDGEYLPGKKGISLNTEQYKALLQALPSINAHLGELGVDIGTSLSDNESEKSSKTEKKSSSKEGSKKKNRAGRANIDATSDENDDEE